jgi:cytochrome c oxidase subunit 2
MLLDMPLADRWLALGLWVVLSAAGIAAARIDIFPPAGAREAQVADAAFRLLMRLAAPVFALVVTVLVVALARRRGHGDPPPDAVPGPEHPAVPRAWFGLTAALAAYVIYNPGLVGIHEMRGDPQADLVVRVEATSWSWEAVYPDAGVRSRELVLPVGRRVRFEITSRDVLHSFWIPAFRTKVDAVPGLRTMLLVTPTAAGTSAAHDAYRLQCAELCGTGHDTMRASVRVVDEETFRRWLQRDRRAAGPGRP